MADFDYGGGEGQIGSGDYSGFDQSQRFDSSQRFDESFRAPDHFHPGRSFPEEGQHLQQDEEEIDDDFKGANGFGYRQADAPPLFADGGSPFEDEQAGRPSDGGGGYNASPFGVDEGGHGPVGNGFGAGANGDDDDTLFSSLPSDGPILPPPEEMKEEGAALREWKRQNAIRLQEKERKEKEALAQVIDDAHDYKDQVFEKRKLAIENGKKNNRDKEKTYLANQETFHKDAPKHYWKNVAELIPNELPTIDKGGKKDRKDKKPGIVAIKGPKPGKSTDVTRLRQVLVKLKHNPPPHMKYKPPPPPAADKDKDKDKATVKDSKDKKDVKPSTEKTDASAESASDPAPPSEAAAVTA